MCDMVFDVLVLIEYISSFMMFLLGDLILIGMFEGLVDM